MEAKKGFKYLDLSVIIVNEGQPSMILISAEYLLLKWNIAQKYITLKNVFKRFKLFP